MATPTEQVIQKAVERYGAESVQSALNKVDRKAQGKRITFSGASQAERDAYGYLLDNSRELSDAVQKGNAAFVYAKERGFSSVAEAASLRNFAKPDQTQEQELQRQIQAVSRAAKLGQTNLANELAAKIVKENPTRFLPTADTRGFTGTSEPAVNPATGVASGSVKQVGAPILTEEEAKRLTPAQRQGVLIVNGAGDVVSEPSTRPVLDEKVGLIEKGGEIYRDNLQPLLKKALLGRLDPAVSQEQFNAGVDKTIEDFSKATDKIKMNKDTVITKIANVFRKNDVRTPNELAEIQKKQKELAEQEIETFNRLNYAFESKYAKYDQIPSDLASQYNEDFNKLQEQANRANNQAEFYNTLVERIPNDPSLKLGFTGQLVKGITDVIEIPTIVAGLGATAIKNPLQAAVEGGAGYGQMFYKALVSGDPEALGQLISARALDTAGRRGARARNLESIKIGEKEIAKTAVEVLSAEQKTKIIRELAKAENTTPQGVLAKEVIRSGTGVTQLIRTADGRTFIAVETERATAGSIQNPQFRGQRNLVVIEVAPSKGKLKVLNTAVGRAATTQDAVTGQGKTYYNITIIPNEYLPQTLMQRLLRRERERAPSTTLELLEEEKATTAKKTPLREIYTSEVKTYLLSQEPTAKALVKAIDTVLERARRTGKIPFEELKRIINIERRLNQQEPFTSGERALAQYVGTTRGTIIRSLKEIKARVVRDYKNIGEGENLAGISTVRQVAEIKDRLAGGARTRQERPTVRIRREPVPSLFPELTEFEKRAVRRIEAYDKRRQALEAVRKKLQEKIAERESLRAQGGSVLEQRSEAILKAIDKKDNEIKNLRNKEATALKAVQDFGKVTRKAPVVSGAARVIANAIPRAKTARANRGVLARLKSNERSINALRKQEAAIIKARDDYRRRNAERPLRAGTRQQFDRAFNQRVKDFEKFDKRLQAVRDRLNGKLAQREQLRNAVNPALIARTGAIAIEGVGSARSAFAGQGTYERTETELASLPAQKSQLADVTQIQRRETTRPIGVQAKGLKVQLKAEVRQLGRERQREQVKAQERLKVQPTVRTQVKTQLRIREALKSQQRLQQRVQQKMRVQQRAAQRLGTRTRTRARARLRTGLRTSSKEDFKGARGRNFKTRPVGFDVEVKVKGKFVRVNPRPFTTEKEAVGYGLKQADISLARSVRPVKTTRALPQRSTAALAEYAKRAAKFRASKRERGVYVEKTQFALEKAKKTPETALIKAARRGAPRLRSMI